MRSILGSVVFFAFHGWVTFLAEAQTVSPSVRKWEPDHGPAGTLVSIQGEGFLVSGKPPEVEFNGMAATVVRASANEVFVAVPGEMRPGPAAVRIRSGVSSVEVGTFTVSTGVPAQLTAARQGERIVLAWPVRSGFFELESTDSLVPPVVWAAEGAVPATVGDLLTVTTSSLDRVRFFRLRTATSQSFTATSLVSASTGGVVSPAQGGSSLVVGPGALNADTRIGIAELAHTSNSELAFMREIVLSPPGLAFRRPAELKLRLPLEFADPASIEVYTLSSGNERVRSGVELTQFHRVTNAVIDLPTRTLTIPVAHFSVFSVLSRRLQEEIVFDIPGKYLKKGDLIYTLTTDAVLGKVGWVPGHCGMYLGTRDATSTHNDGVTIIESTSADTSETKKFGGYVDGVQIRSDFNPSSGAFKVLSGLHLYMGARRPRPEPTDEERDRVAAWALSRVGTPYASLGGTFLSSGDTGLSCVGLTERAYESIGRNIVPGWMETPLMPARQFAYTDQVDEVTIEVGDRYVMDVYGVVAATAGEFSKAPFRDFNLRLSVDAQSVAGKVTREGRAKLSADQQDFQVFTFTPVAEDADLAYAFRFTLEHRGTGNHLRTRPFLIYVRENPVVADLVREDPPVIQVRTVRGFASLTNFLVGEREVILPIGSTNRVRLFWEPPPATIRAGVAFPMRIEADNGTSPFETRTSTTRSPYLLGQIEDFTSEIRDTDAFAGYRFSRRSGSDSIYQLLARPLEKTFAPFVTEDPATGQRSASVTLWFTGFRYLGAFNPVEFEGTVTWRYRSTR